jgi:hypothetical protein
MIVQLDRHQRHRTFDVTATDLPLADLALAQRSTGRLAPVVSVFGAEGRIAGLAGHLPPGWVIRRPQRLDDVAYDEIVLFSGATERDIRTARAVLPRQTRLVTVVDDDAPAEIVAAVLTAGADVCVRGGLPAILASHLVACHRRQATDRWSAASRA